MTPRLNSSSVPVFAFSYWRTAGWFPKQTPPPHRKRGERNEGRFPRANSHPYPTSSMHFRLLSETLRGSRIYPKIRLLLSAASSGPKHPSQPVPTKPLTFLEPDTSAEPLMVLKSRTRAVKGEQRQVSPRRKVASIFCPAGLGWSLETSRELLRSFEVSRAKTSLGGPCPEAPGPGCCGEDAVPLRDEGVNLPRGPFHHLIYRDLLPFFFLCGPPSLRKSL